jgi:hypothetical protein
MAPGIADIEGSHQGHDVVPVKSAVNYFKARGFPATFASGIYDNIKPTPNPILYVGSTKETGANRVVFGEAVNGVLDKLSKEEAARKVMVIDSKFISFARDVRSDTYPQVTWKGLLVLRLSIKNTLKSSSHLVSWNVAIFLQVRKTIASFCNWCNSLISQLPVSVSTKTNSVSSPLFLHSWRWLFLRLPWHVSTTAMCFVIFRTLAVRCLSCFYQHRVLSYISF